MRAQRLVGEEGGEIRSRTQARTVDVNARRIGSEQVPKGLDLVAGAELMQFILGATKREDRQVGQERRHTDAAGDQDMLSGPGRDGEQARRYAEFHGITSLEHVMQEMRAAA